MDLTALATELFKKHLGSAGESLDAESVKKALVGLLGGQGDSLDIQGLMGKMQSSGLTTLAANWLGDGGNEGISTEQIKSMFGDSKVAGFASQLGLDSGTAVDGLSKMLPELVDKSSSGGSLVDAAGGLGGLMGAASNFFK